MQKNYHFFQKIKTWVKWKFFLENYFSQLEERVWKCKNDNPNVWRKTMSGLIWWNIKCFFKFSIDGKFAQIFFGKSKAMESSKNETFLQIGEAEPQLDAKRLNIAFLVRGGMGDALVIANYIYKFHRKYSDPIISIDIIGQNTQFSGVATTFAGHEGTWINKIYTRNEVEKKFSKWDMCVDIARYPYIFHKNPSKISELVPELLEYVALCARFREEYPRFFTHMGVTDGQSAALCILKGRKRIHQPDIYGFLGVREIFELPIQILEDESKYLKSLNLTDKSFIVLHRGNDTNQDIASIKMWPLVYYKILVDLLKQKYPDIVLIQIGVNHERCPDIEGVDVNLVGETTLEKIKVLLKNAVLLIDGEGGMIHMRHALGGGKSIVLFGPTSPEFFGYSENENIKGPGCNVWCEHATHDWQSNCLRGESSSYPPCMASIIPEMLMERVQKIMLRSGVCTAIK